MVQHNTHFTQYKVAELMRTARKRANLSQATVANKLAITQGALSKMEHAQITPSAPQWFEFCRLAEISPDSILLGYIESVRPLRLEDAPIETGYRLEDRFLKQRGLKVRAMLPWALALKEKLGPDAFQQACKERGIDADIFLDHDFQVNVLVLNELMELTKQFDLPISSVSTIFPQEVASKPSLEAFVSYQKKVSCDFSFQIKPVDYSTSRIIIEPAEHLRKIRAWKPERLGNGICEQFKHTLKLVIEQHNEELVAIHDEECLFHDHGKCCSYRIERRISKTA